MLDLTLVKLDLDLTLVKLDLTTGNAKLDLTHTKLDWTHAKLDLTHMKLHLAHVMLFKMTSDMFKSKIDANLVVFRFHCKSLTLMSHGSHFLWFLVIADIQDDQQHCSWSKMAMKSPLYLD